MKNDAVTLGRASSGRRLPMTASITARSSGARGAHSGPDSGGTWNAPNGSPELTHGEVHVWRVDLKRNARRLSALLQTLAPHELAKASQLRLERDRSCYLLAHVAARSIVARYVDTKPAELAFRYGPRGKPKLARGAMHFNMSRSHDLAIVAMGRVGPIGVDIERLRDGIDEEVTRCFSARANHRLQGLPKTARREAFFRAWTRMEAYAKARGDGLDASLDALDRFLEPRDVLQFPHSALRPERGWWLHDFSPQKGYAGALAVPQADCSLRYWQWQADVIGSA
jgi:4'-phosphopantetheinyl transferase